MDGENHRFDFSDGNEGKNDFFQNLWIVSIFCPMHRGQNKVFWLNIKVFYYTTLFESFFLIMKEYIMHNIPSLLNFSLHNSFFDKLCSSIFGRSKKKVRTLISQDSIDFLRH